MSLPVTLQFKNRSFNYFAPPPRNYLAPCPMSICALSVVCVGGIQVYNHFASYGCACFRGPSKMASVSFWFPLKPAKDLGTSKEKDIRPISGAQDLLYGPWRSRALIRFKGPRSWGMALDYGQNLPPEQELTFTPYGPSFDDCKRI